MLKERGLTIKIFNARVRRGWNYEDALNTPKGHKNPVHERKKGLRNLQAVLLGAVAEALCVELTR